MVGAPSLSAYIYIYHMGLEFNLPVVPDNIIDQVPASFHQEPVLARSAPQITFSSAGPRSQQVVIRLHRHLFAIENPHIDPKTNTYMVKMPTPTGGEIIEVPAIDAADLLIKALLTLSLPKYTDSTKAIVPPSLLIRFGNESAIRGIPENVQKVASGVWLKNGKLSDISLSFNVKETEPFSAEYVAQAGTLRSISTTLQRGSVWQY